MEKVYKELDDVKDERDKLKEELRNKESAVKHLCCANDKLRSDYEQKLQKLEGDNNDLLIALDESNMKSNVQEQKLCSFKQEIEGLKELLTVSKKRCCEAEERGANASKELRKSEDMCIELEEENGKYKEQLKWKKEQFDYLEEAHNKMQDDFQLGKKEWAKEKLNLIEEISTLSTSLDSQTRILESLQSRLEMCNHALAHEESKRKSLEAEVSELKQCNESVLADYQEEKTKLESMASQRDEEIASLRNSLGTKQTFSKEMEFRITHLEKENRVLRGSFKEFQEAQIHDAGAGSSLLKIRNNLRGLEKVHNECSMNMKARESEFISQTEKLIVNLSDCKSELDLKDKLIQDLQMEIELWSSSTLQLKVDNDEMYVLLVMYKSGYTDAQSNLLNLEAAMELCDSERRENIAPLMEQLEKKNSSLTKMELHSKVKDEQITHLMEEFEKLESENILLRNEIVKKTSEKKDFLDLLGDFSDRVNGFSDKGTELMANLESTMLSVSKANELDFQVKSLTIIELEEEIDNLQKRLEQLYNSLLCSKQNEKHIEGALGMKQSEIEELQDQLRNQERTFGGVIEKLESEKNLLHDEILKLTSKEFLDFLGDFSDMVSDFSDKDTELMVRLEGINKANEQVRV